MKNRKVTSSRTSTNPFTQHIHCIPINSPQSPYFYLLCSFNKWFSHPTVSRNHKTNTEGDNFHNPTEARAIVGATKVIKDTLIQHIKTVAKTIHMDSKPEGTFSHARVFRQIGWYQLIKNCISRSNRQRSKISQTWTKYEGFVVDCGLAEILNG